MNTVAPKSMDLTVFTDPISMALLDGGHVTKAILG
jgi:hypothetical protein